MLQGWEMTFEPLPALHIQIQLHENEVAISVPVNTPPFLTQKELASNRPSGAHQQTGQGLHKVPVLLSPVKLSSSGHRQRHRYLFCIAGIKEELSASLSLNSCHK